MEQIKEEKGEEKRKKVSEECKKGENKRQGRTEGR